MGNPSEDRVQELLSALGLTGSRLTDQLSGAARCPHCAVSNPVLVQVWHSGRPTERATPGPRHVWASYRCTSCGSIISARGKPGETASNAEVDAIFPAPKVAHSDLPPAARRFLQQAYDALHAPDAAAVMAGSAVDAMLKELGYVDGSVYSRIDKAVQQHRLTEAMGSWAHEVRLEANRPRHADAEKPHVSPGEAIQAVEFAEALGFFLFVLTSRIEHGTKAAKEASQS